MDDRIRVSDADRDRVTDRLRDHFSQGRLTREELDERISAALNAKTVGDLRHVMADLPEPALVSPQQPQWGGPWGGPRWGGPAAWGGPSWVVRRRPGPRFLPVLLLVMAAALLVHGGGWLLFGFLQVFLLFWLATVVGGIAFGVFRRRAHRYR